MTKLNEKKKGIAVVFLAISITVILLSAALVIDIGMLALNKSKLQNACDAAALAGAQELPNNKVTAASVAITYAKNNGVEKKEVIDTAEEMIIVENVIPEFPEDRQITVTAWRNVHFFFAKVFSEGGYVKVSAKASAVNAPINKVDTGLRPFAIPYDSVKDELEGLMTLKNGEGENWKGNFGGVVLDDRGGDGFRDTIIDGSLKSFSIGDKILTLPGDKVGPTKQSINKIIDNCRRNHTPECTYISYNSDCDRLITIPIVNTINVPGSSWIEIVGFARFFLEESTTDMGNGEIKGTFIKIITPGEIDLSKPEPADYFGLRVVKLTN
jgi:hypothetical protein